MLSDVSNIVHILRNSDLIRMNSIFEQSLGGLLWQLQAKMIQGYFDYSFLLLFNGGDQGTQQFKRCGFKYTFNKIMIIMFMIVCFLIKCHSPYKIFNTN